MARRQEERLVETIRQRRRLLGQELRAIVAMQPVRHAVRQRPLAWVAGSGVSGFVAARFLLRPTWKSRRRLARGWFRNRLRDVFLNLVMVGLREGARQGAAERRAASAAGPVPTARGEAAAGTGTPLRASGDAPFPELERVS